MSIDEAARATRRYLWQWSGTRRGFICLEQGDNPNAINHIIYKTEAEAQAACDRMNIIAVLEELQKAGYKLVAREPNFDMGMAPKNRDTAKESGIYAGIWRAMFDAAPAVPAGVLEVGE